MIKKNKKNQRRINDILLFREDISPFLVHLTRDVIEEVSKNNFKVLKTAKTVLEKIISDRQLEIGNPTVSDARYGIEYYNSKLSLEDKKKFFSAICLTETPINEIHCLLEIGYRQINLQPYGLVFLKERLEERGVSPVFYMNNKKDDKDEVIRAMCSLIWSHPNQASELLPLISVFGNKFTTPDGRTKQMGSIDFRWEREWRLPASQSPLSFEECDVFIGLCPHDEIEQMEKLFPGVGFIDPSRNMKWYASKLIDSRKRLELKYSVI